MNVGIERLSESLPKSSGKLSAASDDSFKNAVESAVNDRDSTYDSVYFGRKSFVAMSPVFEKKLLENPELAEETAQKIENLTKVYGDSSNNVIVIDRRGEIKQFSVKPSKREKELQELEARARKEMIKARLRKKARLDAYFKIVERNAIKRKLIEQENAKRPRGRRYRCNTAKLNSIAASLVGGTQPASASDILSMLE